MQYASFRDNIPYMALVVILHPLLRRIYNIMFNVLFPRSSESIQGQGQHRLKQRISYDAGFAAVFTFALHGFSAVKVFFILYTNFIIAKRLPRTAIPFATWTFNLSILFANEFSGGYPYTWMADFVSSRSTAPILYSWVDWLDSHGGLIPRWEVLFKVTALRLISFNMDYCWSLDQDKATSLEVNSVKVLSYRVSLTSPRRNN